MSAPFEIIAGPVDLFLAPTGTAEPLINASPAIAWVKLGVVGSKDYDESAGVLVRSEQTIAPVSALGATGDRKAFRDKEKLVIEVTLMDATAESYQAALNQLAISTVTGPPAEKKIQLLQGGTVQTRALLVRGVLSPYADSVNNTQWFVPLVYQNNPVETVYKKAVPVGLKLQFVALQDDTLGFGTLHMPTA